MDQNELKVQGSSTPGEVESLLQKGSSLPRNCVGILAGARADLDAGLISLSVRGAGVRWSGFCSRVALIRGSFRSPADRAVS